MTAINLKTLSQRNRKKFLKGWLRAGGYDYEASDRLWSAPWEDQETLEVQGDTFEQMGENWWKQCRAEVLPVLKTACIKEIDDLKQGMLTTFHYRSELADDPSYLASITLIESPDKETLAVYKEVSDHFQKELNKYLKKRVFLVNAFENKVFSVSIRDLEETHGIDDYEQLVLDDTPPEDFLVFASRKKAQAALKGMGTYDF